MLDEAWMDFGSLEVKPAVAPAEEDWKEDSMRTVRG
jgi:hypothetical protein